MLIKTIPTRSKKNLAGNTVSNEKTKNLRNSASQKLRNFKIKQ
jgi:hypothetical protein